MFPYILVVLWPLLVLYKYKTKVGIADDLNLKVRNKYLLWSMLPVFLIIAIRGYHMGADTGIYIDDFYRFASMTFDQGIADTRQEAGFVMFVKALSYVISSAKLFQVVYTLIYFLCFYSFLKRLDDDIPFYSLYFFITLGGYLFFFTAVRQCLAISLCLFAFKYVAEKKWFYFFPILALAYSLHHSAALFAIVYPMATLKVNRYNMLLYLVVLYFASTYLVDAQEYLNQQLNYDYEIEKVDSGAVFLVLISILSYLSYKTLFRSKLPDKIVSVFFNINIITLFFWTLRLQTRVAERPSFYFLPFSCVLFAFLVKDLKNEVFRFGVIIVPLLYYLYRFTSTFITFVPYRTFFFD